MPVLTTSGGVIGELQAQAAGALAARDLEPDPGAVIEPHGARRVGVHREPRVGRHFARPVLIAKARVVVGLLAVAGHQDERILPGRLRGEPLAARRRVAGQRIEPETFHGRREQLHLAGARRERSRRGLVGFGAQVVMAGSLQILHADA